MARALSQLAVLLTATACAALPLGLGEQTKQATPIPLDLPATTQAQLRDFELLVNVLRRQHINPRITDEKWLAEADAVRSRIVNGISAETYLREIEKLVEQLNDRSVSIQAPAATPTATNTATTTFSGIGVLVGLPEPDKERLVVLKVYRGSPAEQAGIRPHDSIVAIDGRRVRYDERQTLLSRVRGPSGTQVTLTVKSPRQLEREVRIRRAPITPVDETRIEKIAGTNIVYIVPAHNDTQLLAIEIARGLRNIAKDNAPNGAILDLRLTQDPDFPVTPLLSLFANGPVGSRQTRSSQEKIEVRGRDVAGSQTMPLVLLIGDQTQGPAVSFAAMLQDAGRVTLVGAQTSPVVAEIITLDLSATGLQVTIPVAEYRSIQGRQLHGTGLTPNIDTGLTWEEFGPQDDPQLERAIALLRK